MTSQPIKLLIRLSIDLIVFKSLSNYSFYWLVKKIFEKKQKTD